MLCDDLGVGWRGGSETHKGEDGCVHRAGSCVAEQKKRHTLKQLSSITNQSKLNTKRFEPTDKRQNIHLREDAVQD